jgi:hypothetical protein
MLKILIYLKFGNELGMNWEKWIYSLEDNFGIIKNNGTEHEMNQYTNSELEKVIDDE